jgi:flagellar biogenesis protein FliO
MKRFISCALLLGFATPIFAVDTSLANETANVPAEIVKNLMIMTAVVLSVCVALIWLAQRRKRLPANGSRGSQYLKSVEAFRIDAGKSVHIVQAGVYRLAVSVDLSGIASITAIPATFVLPNRDN